MGDYVSRDAALNCFHDWIDKHGDIHTADEMPEYDAIADLPAADVVEVVRCKDCRWWDKYDDYDNGYCMAAKHGYWSTHWEISIRRQYKGDFYCADAEPKGGTGMI